MSTAHRARTASRPLIENLEARLLLDSQIGTVTLPFAGSLSAGVYDGNGQLVRTLLAGSQQSAGPVSLVWDGKDDLGRPVTIDGTYTWKALFSQVDVVDQGGVGDSTYRGATFPGGLVNNAAYNARVVAVDQNANLYIASGGQEGGIALVKYAQDGTPTWASGGPVEPFAMAVDSTYAYIVHKSNDARVISRFRLSDDVAVPFNSPGGVITVLPDVPYAWPAGHDDYTPEVLRDNGGTWGLAVSSAGIWVSDCRNDKVKLYDPANGNLIAEYSITDPLGMALDPATGAVWVSNNGSRVSRLTFSRGSIAEDTSRRISGLKVPSGLSIGGSSNHLFVGEAGTGMAREYNIAGAGTPTSAGIGTFGSLHQGGVIAQNQFNFRYAFMSLTVDRNGILTVVDDHRVQRFFIEAYSGHTAGEFYQSYTSESAPGVTDTWGYSTDGSGRHMISSFGFVYEVDPEWTGGARSGWLGDGTWRLVERYKSFSEGTRQMFRRVLDDNGTPREFRFMIRDGVNAFAVEPTGLRRAAIVGAGWSGTDRIMISQGGKYNWTDTDGDGVIDWNSQGTGSDGEVTWYTPLGTANNMWDLFWVDDGGNIWTTDSAAGTIVKIALEGFDAHHNPIYNWANKQTVVPFTNDDLDFRPYNIRIAPNGDIIALGNANASVGTNPLLPGGDWVARYDSSGNRTLLMRTMDTHIPGFSADETQSQYIFTGHSPLSTDLPYINMFSLDGLLIAKGQVGAAGAYSGGWMDSPYSAAGFTHPDTGDVYMYAEDCVYGKVERYKVSNLDSIERQEGNFQWVAPVVLDARWKFDANLVNSIGNSDGTFYGGTPAYTDGIHGAALDLDGVDDYVQINYRPDAIGNTADTNWNFTSYTISAWVKATDATSVSILNRMHPAKTIVSHQMRINSSGKFEHSTYDEDSNVHVVTGTTTVEPGTWYHVAITTQSNGKVRLYVNGQEEGTAQDIGWLWTTGNAFVVGKSSPGMSNFEGVVDDLRVYEQSLDSTEIQTLYSEQVFEYDGYWTFNNNMNDAAGTKNGTFSGGSPSYVAGMHGNAIDFDGADDYVNLAYPTDQTAYTISAWVKPTDTSSVSIIVSTNSSGPLSMYSHQLRINASGKFEAYTNDGSGKTVTGTTTAVAGKWYHVAATAANNGKLRLFVDGVEEGAGVSIGTLTTAGDRFYVGSNSGGGMGYFDGLIDDVRVYNEAGLSYDVDDLYQEGDILDYSGRWTFDNTTSDATGAHATTFLGGTAAYATGKIGNAIDLDGVNDYLDLTYPTDMQAYTITAWVKPTDISLVNIIARTNSQGTTAVLSHQIQIQEDSRFKGYVHTESNEPGYVNGRKVDGVSGLSAGQWYFVAVTAQADGMLHLYVNGVEEGPPATLLGELWPGGDRFWVGSPGAAAADDDATSWFDGLIDDLRIYERVLTPMEVKKVMDRLSPPVITEGTPTVAASADSDRFIITRDITDGDLTVNYTMSGTATNGTDYSALSGSVVIPNGKATATLTLTPLPDGTSEGVETATLTISASANYNRGAIHTADIKINDSSVDAALAADPNWTGSGNTANGSNYGWSNTTQAGGAAGEIGGTFARSTSHGFYGDTALTSPLDLNDPISASGKFDLLNITSTWGGTGDSGIFLGHFSQNLGSLEFFGLQFKEDGTGSMRVRLRLQDALSNGVATSFVSVSTNGNHTFSYAYDPALGAFGRLTVVIDGTPESVDLTQEQRDIVAKFDGFGIGIPGDLNDEHPAYTAQLYADDLTYTGFKAARESATVTVTATDASAAESPVNAGTFTITRTGTSGNLTVNYTLGGAATNGTDYSALAGSVVILNGQTAATVTVTPIDDSVYEGSEAVVLTLSAGANYSIGTPGGASVTITDNESPLPQVTITATDATAAEPSNVGAFTVTRNTSAGTLTVYYSAGGTATSGSDYSALSGNVVIASGQTSAVVTLTPVNDTTYESSESVTLTLSSNAAYTIGSPSNATVDIADDDPNGSGSGDFRSNPNWAGAGNGVNGNSFGYSADTNYAGGGIGEVGGTFARTNVETSYADTNLVQSYTLSDTITASGKLTIFGQNNADGDWALGHMSSSTSDYSFVGIRFMESSSTSVRFMARVGNAADKGGSEGTVYTLTNGDYSFTYTYDPSYGSYGRLTVHIWGSGYEQIAVSDLTSTDRGSGGTMNAFGIGSRGEMSSIISTATVQMYVDDVAYSGYVYAKDTFESGNGSGGTGWGGTWTFTGNASVVSTGTPQSGSYHLLLTGNNEVATRGVDLAGVYSARLVFGWKANGFEAGETAVVEIHDGTNWITVKTVSDTMDDNAYHNEDIDLSSYSLTSSFQVRFRSLMSAADDYFYVDNLYIAR